jgi:hypothetical protein
VDKRVEDDRLKVVNVEDNLSVVSAVVVGSRHLVDME